MNIGTFYIAIEDELREKQLTLPELSRALRLKYSDFTTFDLIGACTALIYAGRVGEIPRGEFAPKMFLQLTSED